MTDTRRERRDPENATQQTPTSPKVSPEPRPASDTKIEDSNTELRPKRSRAYALKRGGRLSLTKDPRQRAFLRAFAKLGTITHAADAVGIGRSTHQSWMLRDSAYRERFEEARDDFADNLEEAARKRAVEGYEMFIPNPRTGVALNAKGKPIMQKIYSDKLLETMLKAKRPSEYGEKVTFSGGIGVAFVKPELNVAMVKEVLAAIDFSTLPPPGRDVIEGEARELPAPVDVDASANAEPTSEVEDLQ